MSLIERLTSLFAPDECLVCRREGRLLCTSCRGSLLKPRGVCHICYAATSGVVCRSCLEINEYSSLQALTEYGGVAKQLVAHLKFMGSQSVARYMAEYMSGLYGSLVEGSLIITHVPATTQHIRERGYDQAALLARAIARRMGVQHTTLLTRMGQGHQLGAGREQRLKQLSAAIRARNAHGKHVVLVDDVLTTGASLRAATAALMNAGADKVDCLVFAQAVPAAINKTS